MLTIIGIVMQKEFSLFALLAPSFIVPHLFNKAEESAPFYRFIHCLLLALSCSLVAPNNSAKTGMQLAQLHVR